MKRKSFIYKGLCIMGLFLGLIVMLIYSYDMISRQLYVMLSGFANALFIIGLIFSIRLAVEKNNPDIKKMNDIEKKDERSLFIKRQSGSVAGNILQCLILAAALLFIGLGAPIWVGFTLMGIVMLKSFIEFCLSIYYEDRY